MLHILARLKEFIYNGRMLRTATFSVLIVALSTAVFLPGISGPFIFDDYPNIVTNDALRIQALNFRELYQAAYSVPTVSYLQRPLAYVSFALNGYIAGGFDDATPFKATNLVIHTVNALLIFWVLQITLRRHANLFPAAAPHGTIADNSIIYRAAMASLLWSTHPIQTTSVLYVVQRMASLSSTFILLGVLGYLIGRERLIKKSRYGCLIILGSLLSFGVIGLLVKETAVLLPVFIFTLELTLYSREKPWRHWRSLTPRRRRIIVTSAFLAVIVLVVVIGYWFVTSMLPGYGSRLFTFSERVLTQPRILFFYISLILLPRSNQFGVHHDDIAISTSLFSPWTSLPAILALVAAIVVALAIRTRWPLISLGIFWFLAGHLLESTVFPLEMAHEHRNYLATLGIVIILVQLIHTGSRHIGNRKLLLLLPLLVLVFGSVTISRAAQWSSYEALISYNAIHHPRSARAQLELGGMYAQQGRFKEAHEAYLVAIKYQPRDPSLLIGLQIIRTTQGLAPDPGVDRQIVSLINNYPLNATFFLTLRHAVECLQTSCGSLAKSVELWVEPLLAKKTSRSRKSMYYYYLAISLVTQNRVADAITAFIDSYEMNRGNINALLSLADLYIQLNHLREAESLLNFADRSDETFSNRERQEITALRNKIGALGHR